MKMPDTLYTAIAEALPSGLAAEFKSLPSPAKSMPKHIHRAITKALHPDTTTDEAERRKLDVLMKAFNSLPIATTKAFDAEAHAKMKADRAARAAAGRARAKIRRANPELNRPAPLPNNQEELLACKRMRQAQEKAKRAAAKAKRMIGQLEVDFTIRKF